MTSSDDTSNIIMTRSKKRAYESDKSVPNKKQNINITSVIKKKDKPDIDEHITVDADKLTSIMSSELIKQLVPYIYEKILIRLDEEYDPDYDAEDEENTDEEEDEEDEEEDDEVDECLDFSNMTKKYMKYLNLDSNKKENDMISKDLYVLNSEVKYLKTLSQGEFDKINNIHKDIKEYSYEDEPKRYKILKSDLAINMKIIILNQLTRLQKMNYSDNEYNKLSKWIDGISGIPFGVYNELPVNNKSGLCEINNFLKNIKDNLNGCIYGQINAKNKIIEIVTQWITNTSSNGNVIGLCGSPGTGKTSFCLGLSKALDIPCCFLSLGGASDASYLTGHSYTYEGAVWGKIIDFLSTTKCMNPIIFMDELDKISTTDKGKEITDILVHLTDITQNHKFQDKYFTGIDIDLSKVLFIFSYNDISRVNRILLDRITNINLNNFSESEKLVIGRDYMLPKIYTNIGIDSSEVIISDDIIRYIVHNYTNNEAGVRKLKSCLETIIMKINVLKYTDMELSYRIDNFKLPITITVNNCDSLLKEYSTKINTSVQMMYL
jgi:ATP-dependent Lon protease